MSNPEHWNLKVDAPEQSHQLSVVVPMYNEEELAGDLIQAVQSALLN